MYEANICTYAAVLSAPEARDTPRRGALEPKLVLERSLKALKPFYMKKTTKSLSAEN